MTRLLYLDFDGVLHPEDVYRRPQIGPSLGLTALAGHRLFEHAGRLAELLAPHSDVSIVLSTTWVRLLGYRAARERLPLALAQRVVGATFHSRMDRTLFIQLDRGQQVVADAARRQPRDWVALDDDCDGWPRHGRGRLIQTDGVLGLATPGADSALSDWLLNKL
jgi:hypothetical protein